MTGIHYFPRYSQKENVVTNNTMLFFQKIAAHSPRLLEKLICDCLSIENNAPIEVGVRFSQQVRGGKRIADGVISQSSFQIVIETKLYENFDAGQLEGHLEHFVNVDSKKSILICLAPTQPKQEFIENVDQAVKKFNEGKEVKVDFHCLTFEKLIFSMKEVVSDRDSEMSELVDEFEGYCRSEGLFPRQKHSMRVVLCGQTLEFNKAQGVYFQPASRGYSDHAFIGCYHDKAVQAVGRLAGIVAADLNSETGKLEVLESIPAFDGMEKLPVDEKIKDKIIETIDYAKTEQNWDIASGFLFFIIDDDGFVETEYLKEKKGPLRGPKFFDLDKVIKNFDAERPIQEIADSLKQIKW